MAEPLPDVSGELRSFILERQPVRGFWVRLENAWIELKSFRQYPPAVEALLGEAVTATVLLAATLKFHGTLTLQLNGDGAVPLLVAQCTHDFQVRALAHMGPDPDAAIDFRALVGDGRLTVTIEVDERSRYQGIVALQGSTLAACLESYFATSEQLPTLVRLTANSSRAAGLLLQRLPGADDSGATGAVRSQPVWEVLQSGLDTLDPTLLREAAISLIVPQVCGEYDCRLFGGKPVQFACHCSEPRVLSLLRSLGVEEMRAVLTEHGAVTVTCDFCGRPYRFDAVDVERLFAEGVSPDSPRSIN